MSLRGLPDFYQPIQQDGLQLFYPFEDGMFALAPEKLEVAPHDDGVFASDIIGIRREPSHAEQLVLLLVQRDEGHGAGIVDLGEAREELVREFLARREEAEADVFG